MSLVHVYYTPPPLKIKYPSKILYILTKILHFAEKHQKSKSSREFLQYLYSEASYRLIVFILTLFISLSIILQKEWVSWTSIWSLLSSAAFCLCSTFILSLHRQIPEAFFRLFSGCLWYTRISKFILQIKIKKQKIILDISINSLYYIKVAKDSRCRKT